jgi:hypothetical protein
MNYQEFINEVKKFELLKYGEDMEHKFQYPVVIRTASSVEALLDALEEYVFPVFNQFDVTKREQFALLKQLLQESSCGYTAKAPSYFNGVSMGSSITSHMSAHIIRNVSNNNGYSQHLREPVNIEFDNMSSSSNSVMVNCPELQMLMVDSIVMNLLQFV